MNREPTKTGSNNLVFITGTLIAAVIIIAVLFKAQSEPEYDPELIAIPEPVAEVVIQAPVTPEAVIPEAVEPEPEPEPQASSVSTPPPLPKLDNSDDFIRERLLLISNKTEFAKWVKTDDLLRRTASYADGLSNGVLLSKIFPLSAPEGRFSTHSSDGTIWLNAGNYERYDRTINTLISLPMDSMAKMFHFARPLRYKNEFCRDLRPSRNRQISCTKYNYCASTWHSAKCFGDCRQTRCARSFSGQIDPSPTRSILCFIIRLANISAVL